MRHLIVVAALLAACAPQSSVESPNGSALSAPPAADAAASAPYADAHSTATEAEIRDARRAYRSACQQGAPAGYCECMTASMAQILPPADLQRATAALIGQAAPDARVESARTESERACQSARN